MSEEEVLERLRLMERYKDGGDICTREELEAIGKLLDLYKELKATLEQTQKSWYEDTKIIEKQSKMIELMAEHLTTPAHDKNWVIKYFKDEVELDEEV